MQTMYNDLPPAPPKGFRKKIPDLVKLKVVLRQEGKCASCGLQLGKLECTEFDHVPAIQLRIWDEVKKDTTPPSNDEEHIFAKHDDCHAAKTFGTKTSKRGADVTEIARTKNITKSTEEFRRRMLAKTDPEAAHETERPKVKRHWPKRSFPTRRKDEGTRQRNKARS